MPRRTYLPAAPLLNSRASTAADRLIRDQTQSKFVKQVWYLIGSVLALLICIRVARYLHSLITAPKPAREKDNEIKKVDLECVGSRTGNISVRRLPLAIATSFRIVAFRWTIIVGSFAVSSVSEAAFVLGYMTSILIWLLVDTRDLQAMFWQDRAALFASAQLPLVVSLAGKNNVISFLTGVSHEKLNVLHRAAARTCLVLLWMHAITRTVASLPQQFDFTHTWMQAGAVGLAAFSLAALLSIRPIRHMAFEFFLLSHIILIAVFLICGYIHAREHSQGSYIWPALMIWMLDRLLRLARILYNNRVWSGGNLEYSNATIELLSNDTVRLTLRRRFTWTPGQHAYVMLPSISTLPTESHPFTIASIPEFYANSKDRSVVFLIRGRSGLTLRLRDHAAQNGASTIPAFLDGPYGYPPDLRPFTTCILIAGGSGVSYTLPLLLNLIRENARSGKSAVRRIVFVWAVRDGDHLTWISKTLTDALTPSSRSLTIEPRVYITGPNYPIPQVPLMESGPPSPSSSVESEKGTKDVDLPLYSALKLIHGRPSIRKLLHDEISASPGPVSVDVAGPSALTESVRRALRSDVASPLAVLRGMPSVTLHVETFGMVKA